MGKQNDLYRLLCDANERPSLVIEHGKIAACSDSFLALFGASRGALYGQPVGTLFAETQPQGETVQGLQEKASAVQPGHTEVFRGQFQHKDGVAFPARTVRKSLTLENVTVNLITFEKIISVDATYYQTHQHALQSLLEISLAPTSLEQQLEQALDILLSLPWMRTLPRGGIFLADQEAKTLSLTVSRELNPYLLSACALIPFGTCLCGRAAESGVLQFADCLDDRHDIQYAEITPHGHYNIPISWQNNILGVIVLYLEEGHVRDEQEVMFLEAVANTLATIIHSKQTEDALAKRIRYERGLTACSQALLKDTGDSINEALIHLLDATNIDRVSIFQNFETRNLGLCVGHKYEAFAAGRPSLSRIPEVQVIPYSPGLTRWQEELSQGRAISGAVADMPESERQIIAPYTTSVLILPIFVSGGWYGFISFDDTENPRQWGDEDINLLQTAAQMLGDHIADKRVEEQLLSSQQMLRLVIDNIPQLVFWKDRDGRYLGANQNYAKIIGVETHEDLAEKTDADLGRSDEEVEMFAQQDNRVMEANQPEFHIVEPRMREDQEMWLDTTKVPLHDQDGNVVGLLGMVDDITERKHAEEALKESETQYRTLFQSASDAIFIMQDGLFITCNEKTLAMFGCTREQIINQSPAKFSPEYQPDGQLSVKAAQERIANASAGQPQFFEWKHSQYDNTLFDAEVSLNRIDIEGDYFIQAVVRDISERKQLEIDLQRSETRNRAIVDTAFDAVITIDTSNNIIRWNTRAEQIFGWGKDEAIGRKLGETIIPPRLREAHKNGVARYLRTGEKRVMGKHIEIDAWHRNEYEFPIELSVAPAEVEDEVVFSAFLRDISERRQLEIDLQRSEARNRAIVDSALDAVITIDTDNNIIRWNTQAENIFGWGKDEAIGRKLRETIIPPRLRDAHENGIARYLRTGEKRVMDRRIEIDAWHRNEYEFPIELSISSTEIEGALVFSAFLRDISERRRLEKQLQNLVERREQQVRLSVEVAQDIAAAPALDELFNRVVTLVKEQFNYYHAQIFRYEPTIGAVALVAGYGETGAKMLAAGHTIEMGRGVVGSATQTGLTVLAADVTQDPDWFPNPNLPDTKGELAVPIKLREQVLGILDVQSDQAGFLATDDQLLLEALCGQIAVAIDSTRLRQDMETQLAEMNSLQRIMSREGWDEFYSTRKETETGYIYDKVSIRPSESPGIQPMGNIFTEENGQTLTTPLAVRGETIGLMGIEDTEEDPLSDEEQELLAAISVQVAEALEKARLLERNQQQTVDLSTLNDMGRALTGVQELDTALLTIHQYTSHLMDATNFFIALYNAETETISFPLVTEEYEVLDIPPRPLGNGLTDHVIRSRETLLLNDGVDKQVLSRGLDNIVIGIPAQSWLGVPLTIGEDVIGVICAQSSVNRTYGQRQQDLLSAVAGQAAIAIQNARLFEQTQKQNADLAVLNEMSRVLAALLDLENVVETIHEYTIRLMGSTVFYVGLYNASADEVTFPLATEHGEPVELPARQGKYGLTEHVIQTQKTLLLKDNVSQRLTDMGLQQFVIGEQAASWLGVPMSIGDEIIGMIAIQSYDANLLYSERDVDLLSSIAGQAAIAIQNARLFQETEATLAETEALYQAGAELNTANTFEDILTVLRNHTLLGRADNAVSLAAFERPWVGDDMPEWSVIISRWSHLPDEVFAPRYPLRMFPAADLLRPDEALVFEDIANDERLDENSWQQYAETLKSRSVIIIPLVIARQWIGYVSGTFSQITQFPDTQVRRLQALVGQAAVAIENTRLLEETKRRAGQLQTAAEIARDTSGTLSQEDLLQRAVNLILDRFNYYHASLFLLDERDEYAIVHESTGPAGEEMKRRQHQLRVGSQSIIGTVTQTGLPLVVNDVTKNPVHYINPLLPDTKSELGIPLKISDRVIGALDVQSTEVEAFTDDDVAVLQTLADQIAVAVDNARTYQLAQDAFHESRLRVNELTTLFNTSESLANAPMQSEEIAAIVNQELIGIVAGASGSIIMVLEPESGMMRALSDVEVIKNGEYIINSTPEEWNYHLADYPATFKAMETLQPLIFNVDSPIAEPSEVAYMQEYGVHTMAIFPLSVKGEAIGVVEIEISEQEYLFPPEQITLMTTLVNQAAAALDNARLYEEQQETTERLRDLDTLKNQFLANMSHELRTPLNSIIGFSRVILKGIDGPITDVQEQDLTAIYNSGQHLLGLINDILDFSRIEAGKMELHFTEVNVEEVITSVMSTAKGLVKEKPVRLKADIEPNLPPVNADTTRFRQILLNLLMNASKFTEEGSISVSAIQQIGKENRPELLISVTDTGIGIALEDQVKLFQPFSQVDSSATRKTGGTGLGLSITRNLVELHGGHITLVSEPGKGSTFFFTIPAIGAGVLDVSETGEKVVLAIDDDPKIIQLYGRYLASKGYHLVAVTDPKEAVQQAKTQNPYAITLDVMMPDQDGWQIMKELKANPDTQHIPVIFCTIVEEQARGYSLGAADYLLKPILEDDLIEALERLDTDEGTGLYKVLVIDDDVDDLRLVQRVLQSSSIYQVELAQGGQRGLDAVKTRMPDVIILDLDMPDMSGFQVLDAIQADAEIKNIPIIVLTGVDISAEQQKRLEKRVQDMLRKGVFDDEGLLACLHASIQEVASVT